MNTFFKEHDFRYVDTTTIFRRPETTATSGLTILSIREDVEIAGLKENFSYLRSHIFPLGKRESKQLNTFLRLANSSMPVEIYAASCPDYSNRLWQLHI
ncbi:MAG: hypothetical protein WCJ19_04020 [bacterium]